MKAILISTRPQWVEKILNGIKKDEIRKGTAIGKAINKLIEEQGVAPMLLYCTKGNKSECLIPDLQPDKVYHPITEALHRDVYSFVEEKAIWKDCKKYILNGKVVARFNATAEEIKYHFGYYDMGEWTESYILESSCLSAEELDNYLQASKDYDETKVSKVYGYAIHITKLEIFDKPKELKDFLTYSHTISGIGFKGEPKEFKVLKPLTRAPQSWCYVEV